VINNEQRRAEITILKKDLEIEVLKIRQELNLAPPGRAGVLPTPKPESQDR